MAGFTMFFGFNTFDPKNSPAVSADQESYRSAFTASALGYVLHPGPLCVFPFQGNVRIPCIRT
jgi:hypothetical protein